MLASYFGSGARPEKPKAEGAESDGGLLGRQPSPHQLGVWGVL